MHQASINDGVGDKAPAARARARARARRPALPSVAEAIARHARRAPDAIAIIEDHVAHSYADLAAGIVRCVRALERGPVRTGALVGVETQNRALHLQLLLACELLGAVSLSLSRAELSAGDDLARRCDVLLASGEPAPEYRAKTIPMDPAWFAALTARTIGPADLAVLRRRIPADRIVRLTRSSGTTGPSKLMAMSHATQRLVAARHIESILPGLGSSPRFLCTYHLTLRSIHCRVLGCLERGGTVLFARTAEALALIDAGAVNFAMFILRDIERLAREAPPPRRTPQAATPTLHIDIIGAAVSAALRQQIRQRFHARVAIYYSTNETSRIARMDDDDIGTLCRGVEVRIIDEDGRDKPQGETGIIRVKTDTMVLGYNDDPAATAASFIDGWYHTNDLGHMPAPGKLVVIGRADDTVNLGGVKLSPAPIEARIRLLDQVQDAVLLVNRGPAPAPALLVAIETVSGSVPPGLVDQINPILSPHVRIYELLSMKTFPRTETGKVRRQDIVDGYQRARARRA